MLLRCKLCSATETRDPWIWTTVWRSASRNQCVCPFCISCCAYLSSPSWVIIFVLIFDVFWHWCWLRFGFLLVPLCSQGALVEIWKLPSSLFWSCSLAPRRRLSQLRAPRQFEIPLRGGQQEKKVISVREVNNSKKNKGWEPLEATIRLCNILRLYNSLNKYSMEEKA